MATVLRSEELGLVLLKIDKDIEEAEARGLANSAYAIDLQQRRGLLADELSKAAEHERHWREGESSGLDDEEPNVEIDDEFDV